MRTEINLDTIRTILQDVEGATPKEKIDNLKKKLAEAIRREAELQKNNSNLSKQQDALYTQQKKLEEKVDEYKASLEAEQQSKQKLLAEAEKKFEDLQQAGTVNDTTKALQVAKSQIASLQAQIKNLKEAVESTDALEQELKAIKVGTERLITLPDGGSLTLVWIEPGSFVAGSPEIEKGRHSDELQHEVSITKGFWISKYEVTQEQYEQVMGNNPSDFKGSNLPVESVSWEEAQAFCNRLSSSSNVLPEGFEFRLPTEAEWEYACRAGTTSAFNDGSDCTRPEGKDLALDKLGWFNANSSYKTHPVGQKQANHWGLHDMHGNVWEWCQDWYGDYSRQAQIDPVGPETGQFRVLRGGSFWNGAGAVVLPFATTTNRRAAASALGSAWL